MANTEGGFIAFRAITAEEKEMFAKALEKTMGVRYEPLTVATQVTSHINYAFFCNALVVGADESNAYNAVVTFEVADEVPGTLHISKAAVVKQE